MKRSFMVVPFTCFWLVVAYSRGTEAVDPGPAALKPAPAVIQAPGVAVPEAPRLERLREAKRRGDTTAVLTLEAGSASAMSAECPAELAPRVGTPDPGAPAPVPSDWGGDALITGPYACAGEPALAYRTDGTLYAAALSEDAALIHVFRSVDGGATWDLIWYYTGPLEMGSPSLAIAEGTETWLLCASSYATGTDLASVWVGRLRHVGSGFDGDLSEALSYPYQQLGSPRICVDSPEYVTWYPYVVCPIRGLDSAELWFTRSLSSGQTWESPQSLSSGLTLANLADVDFGGSLLTVAYTRDVGDDPDVFVRLSRDFGATFEPELVVAGSTGAESEPRIASTTAGDLACIAFAREYAPGNRDIDCVFSKNGGSTWTGGYLPFTPGDERRPALAVAPGDHRVHAAFHREGRIEYTWSDDPAVSWAAPVTVSDAGVGEDAWPAIVALSRVCSCNPDMNCDGEVDALDLDPFLLAMNDPAGYAAMYPDCPISQGDADCDDDIDDADLEILLCLVDGMPDCCSPADALAGIAWREDGPPPAMWFDALTSQRPPSIENLIVCADGLLEPALRLAQYHRMRGLPSEVVEVSDLSPGTPIPELIDAGIETIWNVQPRLRFVTLVGDAAQLPGFPLVYPETGEAFRSDLPYACRNTDYPDSYLPALAVGRLPAGSADELQAMVDRVARFEASYGGGARAVFFGNQPEFGYVQSRDAALAASLGYAVTALESPDEATLMSVLNEPEPALVFYYGHGSASANWPLHLGNLDLLTRTSRPMLYFSGGCNFADDHASAPLSHGLLVAPAGSVGSHGGAVAGGYGYNYEFAVGILGQSRVQETLGEMVAAALHSHHAAAAGAGQDVSYGSWIYWFTERMRLIGDPALRLDGGVTAAPDPGPTAALVLRNRPNPFHARTTIAFSLPQAGPCRLSVHDASGRLVAVLLDEPRPAGEQSVGWNGRDAEGRDCPAGIYLCRLVTPGGAATRRLVRLD